MYVNVGHTYMVTLEHTSYLPCTKTFHHAVHRYTVSLIVFPQNYFKNKT